MTRLAAIALLASLVVTPSIAKTVAQPDRELVDIEQKLKERRSEESRLRDEAKARKREVEALRRQMIEAADALQDAERRIVEINRKTSRLEAQESDLKVSLKIQQDNLGDALAALQTIERAKPPALLVSPDDASKAAREAMLLADITPQIEAKAASLNDSLTRLAEVRDELVEERLEFEKTNAEIADRRKALAELLEKKQGEKRIAESLAAAAQSETAALAARASSLREILSRLDRLARMVAPRIKPPRKTPDVVSAPPRQIARPEPFRPAQTFAKAKGALRAPVVGKVIGAFGATRPEGGKFEGLRFHTAGNAIVTAPFEGNVVFARPWGPIGNLIVLDVGGGFHILMLGVGAFLVEEGQTVKAGEPVAAMNGSGRRLDMEIRKDGDPVNPSLWLSDNAGRDNAS